MSDLGSPFSGTQAAERGADQKAVCHSLQLLELKLSPSKQVSEVVGGLPKDQFQCIVNNSKDDFVDEGYCSASPTESETEFFNKASQESSGPEIQQASQKRLIAVDVAVLQLPQIRVTDEKGETEIIAPDDDEHGQLWDFARDKIARRMFFIRADRRTQHMESTFYSDLYPVRQSTIISVLQSI